MSEARRSNSSTYIAQLRSSASARRAATLDAVTRPMRPKLVETSHDDSLKGGHGDRPIALDDHRSDDQTRFGHPASVSDCPPCLATPVLHVLHHHTITAATVMSRDIVNAPNLNRVRGVSCRVGLLLTAARAFRRKLAPRHHQGALRTRR